MPMQNTTLRLEVRCLNRSRFQWGSVVERQALPIQVHTRPGRAHDFAQWGLQTRGTWSVPGVPADKDPSGSKTPPEGVKPNTHHRRRSAAVLSFRASNAGISLHLSGTSCRPVGAWSPTNIPLLAWAHGCWDYNCSASHTPHKYGSCLYFHSHRTI